MSLTDFFPGSVITDFQHQWEDGWYPRGPAIAQGPDGYAAMIIVGDLKRFEDGISAQYADSAGIIRTRNFFSHLDDDLRPIEWVELPKPDAPVHFPTVLGVEEPRLYWHVDAWRFTGAIRQHNPAPGGVAHAALCTVGSPHVEILPCPPTRWMKNLMPSTTCLVDVMQGHPELHGGAVVPIEDGFLGVVHRVVYPERRYDQYFARFDADGKLLKLSGSFRFGKYPLEVATGIVFHRGDVVVGYSVQDRETYLARMPRDLVMASIS